MPTVNLVVVNNPSRWDLEVEGVEVISARTYLSRAAVQKYPLARVFNLCRSYQYQSVGYYVSLLAEARGHRAIPTVATMRDFKSTHIARSFGEEIDEVIQQSLAPLQTREHTIDIYFGQALDPSMARLAAQLYRLFPAPLLRASFLKREHWLLVGVAPRSLPQASDPERDRIYAMARDYFHKRSSIPKAPRQRFLYDLAILVDPREPHPPSDKEALDRMAEATREAGFFTEFIQTRDASRISEFDALFIRQTTAVDHPTYHLSRLAHSEGLAVIDDPWSILRCSNKIYLTELLERAKIPSPRTWILTREDLKSGRIAELPAPCILKAPDAAFSQGVYKAHHHEECGERLRQLFEDSELILAQEFFESEFDWRIGILDHQPLFACKYFMARGHWQIYNWNATHPDEMDGECETIHVEYAPERVVQTALKAANLIGDGFYGVDLKEKDGQVVVIEVNDNPNIDHGIEDAALGKELYRRLARNFRKRIEQARAAG